MYQQAAVETQVGTAQLATVGHLIGDADVFAVQHHTGLDALAESGKLTGHSLGAGEAWSANDGQVFRDTAKCREAQLAPGHRLVAADHVVEGIGGGRALFDDHHIDRHLDHFEDLVHRMKQRARLCAGGV